MKIINRDLSAEKDGIPGYIAYPERKEPGPGIMIVHHHYGVTGHMKATVCNYAKLGYTTIVPDLYKLLGVSDGDLDFDGDGLRNGIEAKAGTKPWTADSNNDGTTDNKDDFDGDGLTNKTEQQLTSKLLTGFVVGLVFTGLGLLTGMGGVVAGIVDALTD